ncbi:hypothetical protein [Spirosoma areae]
MTSVTPKTYVIPVYPLVEKFLSAQYDTQPFMLTANSNPYAGFLYASLERYGHMDAKLPRKYHRLTATLTVGVPHWVSRYGAGAKLTPQKISVFNDFVSQLFFEKLTAEVAMRMEFGAGLKASVQRFLDRYGITEEELSLDTVLRYYARYRRRMLSPLRPTDCCPDSGSLSSVILPHGDCTDWQMESRWGQVA